MTTLYFDIETYLDVNRSHLFVQKPEETAEEFRKRMCLDPDMLSIIGLNYTFDAQAARSGWVGENVTGQIETSDYELTEELLIQTFWALVRKADRLVGFNVLRFDLPALLTRSAIFEIETPQGFEFWNIKPWDRYVIDIFKLRYATAERTHAKSLKELRRIFGLTLPAEFNEILAMDGGSVESLYLDWIGGNDAALQVLKLYGRGDIETTRALYHFWRGYFAP